MRNWNQQLTWLCLTAFTMIMLGTASLSWGGTPRIAAGAYHTVVLNSDGTLWASGLNSFGQLGDGSLSAKSTPVQVGIAGDWIAVAAGSDHTLALKADGSLWAWGSNLNGQLGDGTGHNSPTPVRVGSANDWTAVAAGGASSFALKGDGTLWGWGKNTSGQLGNGSTADRSVPFQVLNPGFSRYVAVSTGGNHTLALQADGTLWGFGLNEFGAIAHPVIDQTPNPTPQQIGVETDWTACSAGGLHSLALKADGTLWAFGSNDFGQLGTGGSHNTPHEVPEQVGTDRDWAFVSAGDLHTLALKYNGTLWSFGDNTSGQLGDGTTNGTSAAIQVSAPAEVADLVAVAAGAAHSLALRADGGRLAWGDNGTGQLGDGTSGGSFAPVSLAAGSSSWSSAAAGGEFTLARRSDGTLWSWGDNASGQLGDNSSSFEPRNTPARVGTAANFVAQSAGWAHSVALTADGALWSWGDNRYGQLGDGSTNATPTPLQITVTDPPSAVPWKAVAAGDFHTLALKADGTLWSFGDNSTGQLGDGGNLPHGVPTQIITGNPGKFDQSWVAIAAGGGHSLALQADGTLWVWGDNGSGQLGDTFFGSGVSTPSQLINFTPPVENPGYNSSWVAIGAGLSHSVALQADGTMWAWGSNFSGQLGNGDDTTVPPADQATPVQVVNAGLPFTAITTGDSFSVARKSDGSLWLWGNNTAGQLGIGATDPDILNPVPHPTPLREATAAGDWLFVSGGASHTIALKADSLWSWGNNATGQLGDASFEPRNAPAALAGGRIVLTPSTLAYGIVTIGLTSSKDLTVVNSGTVPLVVGSVTLGGAHAAEFAVDPGSCGAAPITLAPGQNCTAVVSFTPALPEGSKAATLAIASSDASHPLVTVNLSGNALSPFTIATSVTGNGSITGPATANYGTTPSYTIAAAVGHHLVDVVVNGVSIGAVTSVSLPAISANATIAATFAINSYTVTKNAGANGAITGAASANHGDQPSYAITPNLGYHVADVTVNGASVGAVTSLTLPPVTGNVTVAATFAINSYTVTQNAGANGAITGPASANFGSTPSYAITPNTGYHVTDVTVGGVSQGAVTSLTLTPVTGDVTIAATFAINNYAITLSPGVNGSITGPLNANHGESPFYAITADAGYHVVDVTLNGVSQGAVSTLTISSLTGNSTVAATFAINSYTVTRSAGANGAITGPASATHGSTPSYAITPDTGYHVTDVTVGGVSQGALTALTLAPVTGNVTVAASFAINNYAITLSAGANGSITGPLNANHGDTPVYAITPQTGYHVVQVTLDDVPQGALTSLTLPAVTGTRTVAASFAINNYSVTISAGTGGSITGPASATHGSAPSYTVEAATGYHLVDVLVDGVSQGAVTALTLNPAIADATVTAIFVINSYPVTRSAGVGGAISGPATVNHGEAATYAITPGTGYHLADVTVNGVSKGAVSAVTLPPATAEQSITATFALNTYTITASGDAKGTLSPAGQMTVTHGTDQLFSFTPSAGYRVVDIYVDGVSVGAAASFTLRNVSDQHSIRVQFLPDGDLNHDGRTDVSDVLRLLRVVVGVIPATPADLLHGDTAPLGGDGVPAPDTALTVADALMALKKVVGLSTGW